MTSKEKAEELVFKYSDTIPFLDYDVFATAKKCALICVDEMKLILPFGEVYTERMLYYLEEVKQEINLLL